MFSYFNHIDDFIYYFSLIVGTTNILDIQVYFYAMEKSIPVSLVLIDKEQYKILNRSQVFCIKLV